MAMADWRVCSVQVFWECWGNMPKTRNRLQRRIYLNSWNSLWHCRNSIMMWVNYLHLKRKCWKTEVKLTGNCGRKPTEEWSWWWTGWIHWPLMKKVTVFCRTILKRKHWLRMRHFVQTVCFIKKLPISIWVWNSVQKISCRWQTMIMTVGKTIFQKLCSVMHGKECLKTGRPITRIWMHGAAIEKKAGRRRPWACLRLWQPLNRGCRQKRWFLLFIRGGQALTWNGRLKKSRSFSISAVLLMNRSSRSTVNSARILRKWAVRKSVQDYWSGCRTAWMAAIPKTWVFLRKPLWVPVQKWRFDSSSPKWLRLYNCWHRVCLWVRLLWLSLLLRIFQSLIWWSWMKLPSFRPVKRWAPLPEGKVWLLPGMNNRCRRPISSKRKVPERILKWMIWRAFLTMHWRWICRSVIWAGITAQPMRAWSRFPIPIIMTVNSEHFRRWMHLFQLFSLSM